MKSLTQGIAACALAALLLGATGCQREYTREQRQNKAIDLANKAEILYRQGEYYQAKDLYMESLDWWELPKAFHGLGNCYLSMGQYSRAAYFFRQASASNPNNELFASLAQYATARARGEDIAPPAMTEPPTVVAAATPGDTHTAVVEPVDQPSMPSPMAESAPVAAKPDTTPKAAAPMATPRPSVKETPAVVETPAPAKTPKPEPTPAAAQPMETSKAVAMAATPRPPVKETPVVVETPAPTKTPKPEPTPTAAQPMETPKAVAMAATPRPPVKETPVVVETPAPAKTAKPEPTPVAAIPTETPKAVIAAPPTQAQVMPVVVDTAAPPAQSIEETMETVTPHTPAPGTTPLPAPEETVPPPPPPPVVIGEPAPKMSADQIRDLYPSLPETAEAPTSAAAPADAPKPPASRAAEPVKPMPSATEIHAALFSAPETPAAADPTAPKPRKEILLESPEFYMQQAQSFRERGLLAEALQELYEAKFLAPDKLDIQLEIVKVLQDMKREDRAYQELERLRKRFPHSPEIPYRLGNVHLGREEYAQAVEFYKEALRVAPDFSKAYNNLGVVYMKTARYKEAANAFDQTLALEPDNESAHLNLGLIYEQQLKDPARARYHYRRYVALGGKRASEVEQWIKDLPAAETP